LGKCLGYIVVGAVDIVVFLGKIGGAESALLRYSTTAVDGLSGQGERTLVRTL